MMTQPAPRKSAGLGITRKNASGRRFTFQLKSGDQSPRRGAAGSNDRRYRAGEAVRQSGIYEVVHAGNHREAHEVVHDQRRAFPRLRYLQRKSAISPGAHRTVHLSGRGLRGGELAVGYQLSGSFLRFGLESRFPAPGMPFASSLLGLLASFQARQPMLTALLLRLIIMSL